METKNDSNEASPSQEGGDPPRETDPSSDVAPEGLPTVKQNTEPLAHETQTGVKDSIEDSADGNVFVEVTVQPEEDPRYIDHGAEDARESLMALLKVIRKTNPSIVQSSDPTHQKGAGLERFVSHFEAAGIRSLDAALMLDDAEVPRLSRT